jgi:hypothetical protein
MVSVTGSQARGSLPDMPPSPGQIITLPVGNICEWTGKNGGGSLLPFSHHSRVGALCAPGPAPKHTPIVRLNASRWDSLGLVFIAVSRLASLPAESHIRFALRCWGKHEDPERLLVDRVVVFTDCQDDPLTIDRDCLSEDEP